MKAIINSIKHYVQHDNSSIASASKRTINVVKAVGQAAVSNTEDVVEGSVIKAIFVELWVKSNSSAGTDNKFQLAIEKLPAGATAMTFAQMNTLMGYPNKKNVFFFSQGVLGDLTTQSIPVVRQWFLVPKGKQRFGLDDKFVVTVSATGAALDSCGFSTYKELK